MPDEEQQSHQNMKECRQTHGQQRRFGANTEAEGDSAKAAGGGSVKTVALIAGGGAALVLGAGILLSAIYFFQIRADKDPCTEPGGIGCKVSVRAYETSVYSDITDVFPTWFTEMPTETESPIAQIVLPSTSSQLPACESLPDMESLGLTGEAQKWMIGKGMELVEKLPGYFSEWARQGVQFGAGETSEMQGGVTGVIDQDVAEGESLVDQDDSPGSGMSILVELVYPSGTSDAARWVFLIKSLPEGQPAKDDAGTPVPTQAAGSLGGGYSFILRGEHYNAETGLWAPVCEDSLLPPQATPASGPVIRILTNARCRQGPSTVYPVVATFPEGEVLQVTGRNQAGTWCQVALINRQGVCWVAGNLVDPPISLLNLPVAYAPPPPTATEPPKPGSQPATGFWVMNNPNFPNGICQLTCGVNDSPCTPCTP